MNKVDIESWRLNVDSRLEELTVMNAKQSSEVTHIKETTDEIREKAKAFFAAINVKATKPPLIKFLLLR